MTTPALWMRSAVLTVGTIEITGLRFTFRVHRSLKPNANTCEACIYNLNPDHRSQLEQLSAVPVSLVAGYVGQTSQIFLGDLRVAFATISGTDIISKISGGDGEKAIATTRISQNFRKGTPQNQLLVKAIVAAFTEQEIGAGNLSDFLSANPPSPAVASSILHGSAFRELNHLVQAAGWEWSIQQSKLQFLKKTTALPGQALSVSQKTGMVGSPSVDSSAKQPVLTVTTLLIPDVNPGRLLVLDSENSRLNGAYRIETVDSSGDTHGQEWYHKIEARRY